MYNLIVGAMDGTLPADRLLESVDIGLEQVVGAQGSPDLARLMTLPTLFTAERVGREGENVARVGTVVGLVPSGRSYRFTLVSDEAIPPVPHARLDRLASQLRLDRYEFTRTRWSVRDADLYRVLLVDTIASAPTPTAFRLPTEASRSGRLAVMMPFAPVFDPVWATIDSAAKAMGWKCERADDIWENSTVIDDVVSLIARAEVVLCDLSGRNPNVLYETGIAHTLGRTVLFLAQTADDVPFDLQHHRYLLYKADPDGLTRLGQDLRRRLQRLLAG